MPPRSIERVTLDLVAYHDPIDYFRLRRLVREEVGGLGSEEFRTALSNLKDLGMIEQPGISHEYLHITDTGWEHLGGETPRHGADIDEQDAPVCPVCATDEVAEARWSCSQ